MVWKCHLQNDGPDLLNDQSYVGEILSCVCQHSSFRDEDDDAHTCSRKQVLNERQC